MKVSITALKNQKYAAIVIVVLVALSIVGMWYFVNGPPKEQIKVEEKVQETVTLTLLENVTIVLSPFKYESFKEFWEYYWIGLEEFLLNRTISIEISTKNNVYICFNYSHTCNEMFKGNRYRATFAPVNPWENYYLTIININENNTANIGITDSYKFVKLKFEYVFIWFYIAIACILLVLIIQYLSKLTIDDLETKILAKLFSGYLLVNQRPRRIHILTIISIIFLTVSEILVALQRGVLDTLNSPILILKNLTLDYLYRIYIIGLIYIITVVLSIAIVMSVHYILMYFIAKKFYTADEFKNFNENFLNQFLNSFKNLRMLLIFIVLFIIIFYLYSYSEWSFILISVIVSLLLGLYLGFLLSRAYLRLQKQKHLYDFRYIKMAISSTVITFLLFTSILNECIYLSLPLIDRLLSGSVLIEGTTEVFPTTSDFLNLVNYTNIFYVLGSLYVISVYYFFLIFTIFLPLRSSVSANKEVHAYTSVLKYELKCLFMDDLINDIVFPALIFLVSIWLQYYITGPLEWEDIAVSFLISFIAGFFANYLQGLRQGKERRE